MNIYRRRVVLKIVLLFFAVIIGLCSLIYTHDLVSSLKKEEKKKAEQWAEATRQLAASPDESEILNFLFNIVESNTTVPVILLDENDNILSHRNLAQSAISDTVSLMRELKKMGEKNDPIIIRDTENNIENYLYFEESTVLRQLKIYPYIQLAVILLFIAVSYIAFNATREAEQNQVWLGLSRETAHQLGTPTSSLSAWVELYKSRYPDSDIAGELSADVLRLNNIAERFSLIGSRPKMFSILLPPLLETTTEYLKKRMVSTIEFRLEIKTSGRCEIPANAVLLGWVIENLVKNAADAMKGTGIITLRLSETDKEAIVDIEDTGIGVPKKDFRTIFKPGYTTRERGWGLGLSLSKRIIEEYHKGKIFVKSSESGKGTCMRIILKKH